MVESPLHDKTRCGSMSRAAGTIQQAPKTRPTSTVNEGNIAGFERLRLPGDGVEIDALVGGSGPPLLLLHGFPQTRRCWSEVAPTLTERFTVVIPDLRGYGRSDKPPGDMRHITYSKRALAKDQVATMQSLGFSQFSVAGHDRGGRVAYRLALDFPKVVTRIAVLDIVPTSDAFALMNAASAMKMWHWLFQVHENGLPERMIAAVSDEYVSTFLSGPAAPGFQFNPMSLHDYLACFRSPEAIHAACEDYRAAWHVDRRLDEEQVGKIKLSMPLLILWADEGGIAHAKPLEIWRRWADDVQGHGVPGGHFLPEESPKIVTEALVKFFDG